MAKIGLRYLAWAKLATETDSAVPTYNAGLVLGEMASANLTINNTEAEQYLDDHLSEKIKEFASGSLTVEAGVVTLANQATLYGATITDGELMHKGDDTAPFGGIAMIEQLLVNGARKFVARFFPKAQANVPDWSATTKSNSGNLGTQPLSLAIFAPKFGAWMHVKQFDTFAAAKAYVDTKLGVATWYAIDVQVQGATGTEAATPVGVTPVASAGTFELAITGTATKLYDNGTDSTDSISGGKYTLSSVAADHKIAVIF